MHMEINLWNCLFKNTNTNHINSKSDRWDHINTNSGKSHFIKPVQHELLKLCTKIYTKNHSSMELVLLLFITDGSGPETQRARVRPEEAVRSRPEVLSTYFLGLLETPLPPASSSSDAGWRFSFSGFLLGPPKKSPMPFCHCGVGRGNTGLPPAYLPLAEQNKQRALHPNLTTQLLFTNHRFLEQTLVCVKSAQTLSRGSYARVKEHRALRARTHQACPTARIALFIFSNSI